MNITTNPAEAKNFNTEEDAYVVVDKVHAEMSPDWVAVNFSRVGFTVSFGFRGKTEESFVA